MMSKRTLQDQPASDFEGVAIMLVPQDEDAATVAPFAAVAQEHLHTTLAFLGDAKALKERGITCDTIVSALLRTAHNTGPVKASLGGITRFSVPGDGPDPLVLNVSSRGIEPLREEVLSVLSLFGIEEDTEHGYTPHMTLGYLPKKNTIPMKRWEPVDIFYDRIRVGFGGEEVDLPLDTFGGPIKVKALPKTQKCKFCPEQASKRIIHSEGMAYVPVCDEHVEKGKDAAARCTPDKSYDESNINAIREIKGVRRVRTPEGAATYGQPIGSIITRDVVPEADLRFAKTTPVLAKDLKEGDHVIHDDESHEVTDVMPVDGDLSIGLKSDRTGEQKAVRKSKTSIFAKIVLGVAATIIAGITAASAGMALGGGSIADVVHDDDKQSVSVDIGKLNPDLNKMDPKPAPTTAKGYADMFADVPTQAWGAADASISSELPDGRRVWLYGDTFSDGGRFVHSTAIVQDGGNLHVSDDGGQVLPDEGTITHDGKEYDRIYWVETVKTLDNGNLAVTTMPIAMGDSHWDFFRIKEDKSRVAELSVDDAGDVSFEGWKGYVDRPAIATDGEDYQKVGDHHYTYQHVVHDIELANGKYLKTNSQNWDDDINSHVDPDTGELRYVDFRPQFGTSETMDSGFEPNEWNMPVDDWADFEEEVARQMEGKAVPLKCGGCKRTYFTDDMTDWACPNCGHKQEKDVFGGLSGGGLGYGRLSQHGPPVTRPHRLKLRKQIATLVPNATRNVQIKAAKDGDGDGWINDGKPNMMPAPAVTAALGDLKMVGPSEYGKEYGIVGDKHGDEYLVGPDMEDPGFFAAGLDENDELNWDDLAVEQAKDLDEVLSLLDARTRQPRKIGADPVKGSLSDTPTKINLPKRSTAGRAADAEATRSAQAAAKKARSKKAAPAKKASAAKKASTVATRAKKAATTAKKLSKPKTAPAKKKAKKEWAPGDPYRQVDKGKDVMGEPPITVPKGDIEEVYTRTFIVPKRQKLDVPIIKPGSKTDQELRRVFVIPPAYTRVRYNVHRDETASDADYNGLLYEAFDPNTGKWQAVYSTRHWIRQAGVKFSGSSNKDGEGEEGAGLGKVSEYLLHRDKIIDKFIKDSKSKDPKIAEPAKALLLQAISGIRAGTPHKKTEARIDRRFGASTLQARHVKFNSDGSVTLSFMAKGNHQRYEMQGRKQKLDASGKPIPVLNPRGKNMWPGKPYQVKFTDPRVASMLKSTMRGKSGEDELFDVNANAMNSYFDDIQKPMGIKSGLTTHNLRHGVATLSAVAAITKIKKPKTEAEYIDALTKACQTAAISINDSAKVAFRSYIDHNLWLAWTAGHPEWKNIEPKEFKK